MGNQICPGSTKNLIQQLGQIQNGEISFEPFFKGCFQFKENKLQQILVSQPEDQPQLMELIQHNSRSHFPKNQPLSHSLLKPQEQADRPQHPKEDEIVDLHFEDDNRYKGPLKDGLPHGVGQESSPLGDRYYGNFKMGVKEGHGIYSFANGERYEGEFKQNAMWGQGTYFFLNGDNYEGIFKRNKRSGLGRYTYGDKKDIKLRGFEGEYSADVREGGGKLNYDSFEMRGNWKNGLYQFSIDPNLIK